MKGLYIHTVVPMLAVVVGYPVARAGLKACLLPSKYSMLPAYVIRLL